MPLRSSNSTNSSDGTSSSTSVPVDANDGTSSSASVPVDTEVNSAETSEVNAPASLRSTDEDDSVSLVGYCYCGQGEDYDDMICGDNKDCVIGWFHFSCLKITKKDVPKGKYYCPASKGVPRDQNQRRHQNFINNLICILIVSTSTS